MKAPVKDALDAGCSCRKDRDTIRCDCPSEAREKLAAREINFAEVEVVRPDDSPVLARWKDDADDKPSTTVEVLDDDTPLPSRDSEEDRSAYYEDPDADRKKADEWLAWLNGQPTTYPEAGDPEREYDDDEDSVKGRAEAMRRFIRGED